MGTTKEAYLRYKIIDACIINKYKPYPNMDELIDAVEDKIGKAFSISAIQKDIKSMKEDEILGFLAPIKYSRSREGYYYADPAYAIRNIPINELDIEALLAATDLLSTFNGNRVSINFGHAVDKIIASSKEVYDTSLDKRAIIQTESSPNQRGWEHFDILFQAAKENDPVCFVHYSYQKRRFNSIVIHPYLLKEFQNRWYLIGYSENHKAVRTFGLDRVYEPYLLASKFYLMPSFNAEKHFKNVYGVYPLSKKEEKIIFRITPSLSDYLISQPIHDSQKVEKYHKHGSLTLSIKLIVSQELINFFQMRRDDLEVFEPKWLVDKLYGTNEK